MTYLYRHKDQTKFYGLTSLFSVFCQVIGYQPRPVLRINPPQGSSDWRVKVYSYIEAISSFPTNFTPAEYRQIMTKVNPKLYNPLRETFLVLNDDLERVNVSSRAPAASASSLGSGSNATALGP